MKISFLTDNPTIWIIPYVDTLEEVVSRYHQVIRCYDCEDIPNGDICFFLSCEKIVPSNILKRNTHNIVIHPSRLPHGKGFSPLAWQILEGKNEIPITLFEAEERVDSGVTYYRDTIKLEGHELNSEIKKLQAKKTMELILHFIDSYPNVKGYPQKGEESFYKKRGKKDSELDINKSIAEQFNLLRIVDNERYPAFFRYMGNKYILKIYKEEE